MPAEQQSQQQARAEISSTERTRLVTLVSWLTVTLPRTAPEGLVVTRDGEPFGGALFGVALAVDPGPHVFTTRAPGGPLIEQRVDISAGERKAVTLDVRTSDGEAVPDVPPPEEEVPGDVPPETAKAPGRSPWVYVAGGIGAAGLVTGTVTGIILLGKRKTIFAECDPVPDEPGKHECSDEGLRAVNQAQNTLAPVTTIAFGVGAAGAIATVVLLIAGPSSPRTNSTFRAAPSLDVRAGGATLGFSGHF
jgi:hypothetical protein